MSLVGKNRALFSYNNRDKSNSNFMYKDFEKSNSYRSIFDGSNFNCASFRAAKFKFCTFRSCSFVGAEFVGTNLRGSNFEDAIFENAIFNATVLDGANFKNATFRNCIFLSTSCNAAKNLPKEMFGITVFDKMPNTNEFPEELISAVEALRGNDIIRRSNVFHCKKGKINTISLLLLLQDRSAEELIKWLPTLPQKLTTQFYTISYIKLLLKKDFKTDIL